MTLQVRSARDPIGDVLGEVRRSRVGESWWEKTFAKRRNRATLWPPHFLMLFFSPLLTSSTCNRVWT